MVASIAIARGAQKSSKTEPPNQGSSKKARTSSGSSLTNTTPRLKIVVTQWSDELALEVLLMLPPEVKIATFTFYKFLIDRW